MSKSATRRATKLLKLRGETSLSSGSWVVKMCLAHATGAFRESLFVKKNDTPVVYVHTGLNVNGVLKVPLNK